MTKKENLLRLLAGEKPAWVPCSINFAQWFTHHRNNNILPPELQGKTFIEAMKVLGCDIFSRNLDGGFRDEYEGVHIETITEPAPDGERRTHIYHTPYGNLQRISEDQKSQSTSYMVEDMVKDWDRDSRAYLWLQERHKLAWDRQAFERTTAEVGDDGVVMVPFGHTPLKSLHIDFGLDHACLFMMDYPDAAKTVCDLYWQKMWPMLQQLADHPQVHAACIMDNVDAPFYPPSLCQPYWTPYVRQAADLFDSKGKRLFVHACGRLHQLKDVFRQSGVHGLEGMAHAPLGDWAINDAQDISPKFIYNGGFSAHEQVIKSDDEVQRFYERFFRDLNGFPRFIFAAACQTTVTTPWDRIKLAVKLCREHGGQPTAT